MMTQRRDARRQGHSTYEGVACKVCGSKTRNTYTGHCFNRCNVETYKKSFSAKAKKMQKIMRAMSDVKYEDIFFCQTDKRALSSDHQDMRMA